MRRFGCIAILGLLATTGLMEAANAAPPTFPEASITRFIAHMVEAHHFERKQLVAWFDKIRPLPGVLRLMHHPFEALPWKVYRRLLVTPARVRAGKVWMARHRQALAQEEQRAGIPAAVIAAIIGIETNYGQNIGNIPAFASLATLAFNDPSRAPFFRHELSGFLRLCRRNHYNPLAIRGSYAGALGIPQFMPTAYLRYATERLHGLHPNLFVSSRSAIESVGRFLSAKGWRKGHPVAIEAALAPNHGPPPHELIGIPCHPHALRRAGLLFTHRLKPDTPVTLIALVGAFATHYWITLPNFHALMAYNPSIDYSMAVFELALKLQAAH
ncbi:MAG: lytic murein transglycosylase [Gammaproteobacteria bacterium]